VREKARVNCGSSFVRSKARKEPNRLVPRGSGIHGDIPTRRRHSVFVLKQQDMFLHGILRPLRLSPILKNFAIEIIALLHYRARRG
jgi:hypothetical protein